MALLFEGDTIEDGLVTRQGIDYSLDATLMNGGRWYVRPANTCGTCGWYHGRAWTGVLVQAPNAEIAIRRAGQYVWSREA